MTRARHNRHTRVQTRGSEGHWDLASRLIMGIAGVVIRLITVINLLLSKSSRPSEYAVDGIATVARQIPVAGDSIIQGFPVEIRGTSTNSYYRSSTSHIMNTYNSLGLTCTEDLGAPERRQSPGARHRHGR